jgi:hypothetical protein
MVVQVFGNSAGYALLGEALTQVAGKEAAEIFQGPFSLSNRDDLRELFVAAGVEPVEIESEQVSARFPSLEAMVRTEIDGWVLRGQVDINALLSAVGDRLEAFCGADGSVRVPIEVRISSVRTC